MGSLSGFSSQLFEQWVRKFVEFQTLDRKHSHLEQSHAWVVSAALLVETEQMMGAKRLEQPIAGTLVQSRPLGDFDEPQSILFQREATENLHGSVE
jgi:hypothetical protein